MLLLAFVTSNGSLIIVKSPHIYCAILYHSQILFKNSILYYIIPNPSEQQLYRNVKFEFI